MLIHQREQPNLLPRCCRFPLAPAFHEPPAPHCSAGIELVTRPAPQAPEAPDPAAAGGRMDESERELMSDLNLQLAMFSNLSVRDRDSQ